MDNYHKTKIMGMCRAPALLLSGMKRIILRRYLRLAFVVAILASTFTLFAAPSAYADLHGYPDHYYDVRCKNIPGYVTTVFARPTLLKNFWGIDEEWVPTNPSDPYPGTWAQPMYYRIWYSWGGRWYAGERFRVGPGDHTGIEIPDYWNSSMRAWTPVTGGYYGTVNYGAAQDEVWANLPVRDYRSTLYIGVQTYWDKPFRGVRPFQRWAVFRRLESLRLCHDPLYHVTRSGKEGALRGAFLAWLNF